MTRQLTDEQLDTLADVALDMDQRIAAEDAAAASAQDAAQPQPA